MLIKNLNKTLGEILIIPFFFMKPFVITALLFWGNNHVSGYSIDYCDGCTESLFRETTPQEVEVTPDDIGKLVRSEIDDEVLLESLKATVPTSDDLDELWSAPKLDRKFGQPFEIPNFINLSQNNI